MKWQITFLILSTLLIIGLFYFAIFTDTDGATVGILGIMFHMIILHPLSRIAERERKKHET